MPTELAEGRYALSALFLRFRGRGVWLPEGRPGALVAAVRD